MSQMDVIYAGVAEQEELFRDVIDNFNGQDFAWDTDESKRKQLWTARHNSYHASRALRPTASGLSTDAYVPISCLAECVTETIKDIKTRGMLGPVVVHVGDGNFHVLLLT